MTLLDFLFNYQKVKTYKLMRLYDPHQYIEYQQKFLLEPSI